MSKRTKNELHTKLVNPDFLLVGVDIGKYKNCVFLCNGSAELTRKPFFISNTLKDFQRLVNEVETQKDIWGMHEVFFGMEPSGSYGKPLHHYLRQRGYEILSINPLHTKRLKDVEDNHPTKDDSKDCKTITTLMRLGKTINHRNPQGCFAELNNYATYYYQAKIDLIRNLNHLEAVYGCYFPELSSIIKLNSRSGLTILEYFPFPSDIVKTGYDNFYKVLKQKSRSSLSTAKIDKLYQAAVDSVGIHQGQESIRRVLSMTFKEINFRKELIKQIKSQIFVCLESISYTEFLCSIPGLSKLSIGLILAETGDLRQYTSYKDLINLAGLSLKHSQSGCFRSKDRISKVGRGKLRSLLYMLIVGMTIHNSIIAQVYHYHTKIRHKNKVQTLVACCSKLLGIMYSIVKYEKVFDSSQCQYYAGYSL